MKFIYEWEILKIMDTKENLVRSFHYQKLFLSHSTAKVSQIVSGMSLGVEQGS